MPATYKAAVSILGGHAPKLSRAGAVLVASLALALISVGDYYTGWYFLFDFFYLIPLTVTTIYVGKRSGMSMSFACTVAWMAIMVAQGHPLIAHTIWPGTVVLAWNFLARMTVQSTFVLLLSRLKDELVRQSLLVAELQEALEQVRQLRTLIPICAWCKKIRDDAGYWTQLERYMHERDLATFTHGICPECATKLSEEDAIQ